MTAPNFAHRGAASENWPRCWACNRRAPRQNNNQRYGWVARNVNLGQGRGKCREMYCRDCFKEWGWPEDHKR